MSEQIVSGRPPLKQYSSDVIVKTPAGDSAMDDTNDAVRVNVVAGGAGDGAILDGVSSAIKASVLDYTNSNPVAVRLTNTDGDYVAAGAGTQYADGAVRGTATGTLALGDDGTNIQSIKVDSAGELQVDVITSALPTGASTSAKQDTLLTELQLKADLTETQPVSLASVPSHAVTNAGTFATQATLQTGSAAIGKLAANSGVDIGDVDILSIAAGDNNIGNVDIISMPAVDTELTTGDLDTGVGTDTRAVVGLVGSASGGGQLIPGSATDGLLVNLGANNDVVVSATDLDIRNLTNVDIVTAELSAVDNAVLDTIAAKDFATQTTLAAINAKLVTGTDIGDVTINNAAGAAAVNIQDGGNAITVDGTVTETNSGAIKTAVELIDNAISGTEMQVDVVAALPAGTNAIGKLLPPDIDVTTHTNYIKKYYTNAGAVTDGIIWSSAAGKRWHVVTLYINVSAAATVTLEDDLVAGDSAVWKGELAANSGVVINFGEKYPLASGEDAADLLITTSAGNVYVTAVGFEI